ncbi:DinB family protein [Streptomyces sp. NPDC014636]|uniref:DinB family protein n=1 Tax=Streptomyces sp. NPDC014636 TaxID=3364876 RepID=UPI0036FF2806
MTVTDPKTDLQVYLQDARDVLLWKLEGLSEYDVRRPLTPTGTNLLGLVKHLTGAEALYFGAAFDRPFAGTPLWFTGDADPDADLWARAAESREDLVGGYRDAWAHADATIAELPLDAVGRIPGDGPGTGITLHRVLTHMIAETQRHAGHADVVRELIDGSVGQRPAGLNVAPHDPEHVGRVERAAREAAARWTGPTPSEPTSPERPA